MIQHHSEKSTRTLLRCLPVLMMAVFASLLFSACTVSIPPAPSGSGNSANNPGSSFTPTKTPRPATRVPRTPTKTGNTGGSFTPTKTPRPPTAIPRTPTKISSGAGANVNYPPMPAGLQTGRVVKVVDGDTVDVSIDGQTERVRMIGINTPESVDPRRVIQCFGVEASSRAKKLLSNQTVGLEMDPTQGDTDQYGRLLRYIWFSDGRMFNLQMLAEGFANEFTFNIPYKYQKLFKSTARAADFAGVGLWSPNTCNGDFNSPTKTP